MHGHVDVRLIYFSLGFTCVSHLCILAMVVTVTGMYSKVPKHHLGSFDRYKLSGKEECGYNFWGKSHLNGS